MKPKNTICHKEKAEQEVITLTEKESANFVNILLNPPKPNNALQKAAKKWTSKHLQR